MNRTDGISGARFGNFFFRNLAVHCIAKKNNIPIEYYHYGNYMKDMGIDLYSEGNGQYNQIQLLTEDNFFDILQSNIPLNANIQFAKDVFCQTREFSNYARAYLHEPSQKNKIIQANIFKERYNNNKDVFIHVRLGDSVQHNPGFVYYDHILSQIEFENGYISSDSIWHPICQELIKKYNLQIIQYNEVNTIMFASTCKYILLSHGTFSWMIGVLAYYSVIYYAKRKSIWHGDIFVFDDWNEIDTDKL